MNLVSLVPRMYQYDTVWCNKFFRLVAYLLGDVSVRGALGGIRESSRIVKIIE